MRQVRPDNCRPSGCGLRPRQTAEILLDRPNIDAAEPNTDARSRAQYIDIEFSPSQHASDFTLSLKIKDFQQCCLRVARQTKNITRRFLREGLIVTALRVNARTDPTGVRMWVNEVRVTGTEFEADI